MGRRNRGKGETVSLFPFLSILSCLIGSLTLMISTMAMVQIDPSEAEDPDKAIRADEFAFLQKELKDNEKTLSDLLSRINKEQKGLKSAMEQMKKIEELKKKIAELKQKLAKRKQDLDQKNKKKKEEETWKLELQDLANEQKRLDEQLATLLKEMKEKESELAKRKEKPKEADVQILPGGSGVKVNPFFIECNRQGLVMLDEPKQPRILRKEIKQDKRFLAVMERVKKNDQNSIIFLIRPDGVSTYWDASRWANENYARNGKLPILGQGMIDLSLMRKKGQKK